MSLEVIKRNIEQEKEKLEVHSKVMSLFNSIVKEKQTEVLVASYDVTDEMTRVSGNEFSEEVGVFSLKTMTLAVNKRNTRC